MITVLALVFAVSVGFGVVAPVLPALLERIEPGLSAAQVAWHTGLLTGIYTFMGFACAGLWGQLSDRVGRKRVLLASAGGYVLTLASLPFMPGLFPAYLSRALAGIFAAAVLPVGLAWISDSSADLARARRFARASIASLLGFLVGPVLGAGLTGAVATAWLEAKGVRTDPLVLPFLAATALGVLAWALCLLTPTAGAPATRMSVPTAIAALPAGVPAPAALLTLSSAVAFALGAYEVGLTLFASRWLGLAPGEVARMFVECSAVMIGAQALISVGLVERLAPTRIIAVAVAALTTAFALLPYAQRIGLMSLSIGVIAAGIGILGPMLAYWISVQTKRAHGAGLGLQASFTSLGQALGSASGGGLFGLSVQAPFWVASAVVLASWLAVMDRRRPQGS